MRPRGLRKTDTRGARSDDPTFLCRTVPGSHGFERAYGEMVPRERGKLGCGPGFHSARIGRNLSQPAPRAARARSRAGRMCQPTKCSRGSDGAEYRSGPGLRFGLGPHGEVRRAACFLHGPGAVDASFDGGVSTEKMRPRAPPVMSAEQVQGWQDRPGPHRIERVCGEMVMREKR